MLIYTLLFTLINKYPESNKYIDMFYIWLSYLIKNSGLLEEDTVIILLDEATMEQLNSNEALSLLVENIPFTLQFQTIPRPSSVQAGILERYAIDRVSSPFTLFLDIDVLVLNNIKKSLLPPPANSILVMPEGELLGDNYAFDLVENSDETKNCCGFTAGWFAFTPGEGVKEFFKKSADDYLLHKTQTKYTEQSFFNKYVYLSKWKKSIDVNIYLIHSNTMPNNEYSYSHELFMNYCGEVGNASTHFVKTLTMLCIDFIRSK